MCDWICRHKTLPEVDGWDEEDVYKTIDFLLTNDSPYLNDLQSEIRDRTLKELCQLCVDLRIKGVHVLVKSNCIYCGKDIEDFPSVYLKNSNMYCSHECYIKDKPRTVPKGEDSPFYKRITTKCANCGKEMKIIPFEYNMTNEYGDNFNYCSRGCYNEFRSKYYIGEKHPQYGVKKTPEELERMRNRLLERLNSDDRLNTSIQLAINEMLDVLGTQYTREKIIGYYSIDNYLVDNNLCIEVMGDYWHGNPIRYNNHKYKLNEIQSKQIIKDKQKYRYLDNHGYKTLYLWEHDINTNKELCFELIKYFIERDGEIENKHSFNYKFDDDFNLVLKEKIIIPYQEMSISEYRNLIV